MKHWYVVYTRTGMERITMGHLETQGYTVYLPQRLKERRHARRIDTIKTPLFPRYLFVELDLSTDRWHAINGTYGVTYLITMGDRPSAVPPAIVETIRAHENAEGLVEITEPCPYETGDVIELADDVSLPGVAFLFFFLSSLTPGTFKGLQSSRPICCNMISACLGSGSQRVPSAVHVMTLFRTLTSSCCPSSGPRISDFTENSFSRPAFIFIKFSMGPSDRKSSPWTTACIFLSWCTKTHGVL